MKKSSGRNIFFLSAGIAVILLLFSGGFIVLNSRNGHHQNVNNGPPEIPGKKIYVCSMEPWITQDEPGTCPICGMALIEKTAGMSSPADPLLNDVVCPVNQQVLACVQTVCPVEKEFPVLLESTGTIGFDTRKVTTVSAKVSGLIERSYVRYRFQPVAKGQKIYDIFCPEIFNTKINYVNIIRNFPGQKAQVTESEEWLRLQGLTDDQIRTLATEQSISYHFSVFSNADGYAVEPDYDLSSAYVSGEAEDIVGRNKPAGRSGVVLGEGILVDAGTPLFKVISTSTLQADLKVRSSDAALLRAGQKVTLIDPSEDGGEYAASVSRIEPLSGGLFQQVTVYLPAGKGLFPGKKIRAMIRLKAHHGMWVPSSSVINLGLRKVVVVMYKGVMVARQVKTGLCSGNMTEICSGINMSDKIALFASMLYDSDAFIRTSPAQ